MDFFFLFLFEKRMQKLDLRMKRADGMGGKMELIGGKG